jgi:hypothetical protein
MVKSPWFLGKTVLVGAGLLVVYVLAASDCADDACFVAPEMAVAVFAIPAFILWASGLLLLWLVTLVRRWRRRRGAV